jgi:hypothetical protein
MVSGGGRNASWHEATCPRRPAERIRAFSLLNPMVWWFITVVAAGTMMFNLGLWLAVLIVWPTVFDLLPN